MCQCYNWRRTERAPHRHRSLPLVCAARRQRALQQGPVDHHRRVRHADRQSDSGRLLTGVVQVHWKCVCGDTAHHGGRGERGTHRGRKPYHTQTDRQTDRHDRQLTVHQLVLSFTSPHLFRPLVYVPPRAAGAVLVRRLPRPRRAVDSISISISSGQVSQVPQASTNVWVSDKGGGVRDGCCSCSGCLCLLVVSSQCV